MLCFGFLKGLYPAFPIHLTLTKIKDNSKHIKIFDERKVKSANGLYGGCMIFLMWLFNLLAGYPVKSLL